MRVFQPHLLTAILCNIIIYFIELIFIIRFPKDEPSRNKWLHVVRKQRQEADWLPTNSSRLCSVHFKPRDMYTTNKGYKKLHKRAYPYFLVSTYMYTHI